MRIRRYCKKKSSAVLIYVLFFTLLVFLIIDGYLDLNRDLEIQRANGVDMIDQRMNSIILEMNIFPRSITDDLLFLSGLSSLDHLMDYVDSNSREKSVKDLESDLFNFLKESTAYYQLRYIDEKGNEIVRVEFDGDNYFVVPNDKLQNKKGRYYFSETMSLNEGEVFISPLDLNIERGGIENRGTPENPEYVPVMRIATPIFNGAGVLKGIVLFNVYADYFLEDVRRAQRNGEKVFLINKEGFYLAHPDKNKEFGFIFGKNDTFYNDYSQISKDVLLDLKKRRFETEKQIFSFRYIYPTTGDIGIHKGSEKLIEENYFWILVTISNNGDINIISDKLKKDYIYFLLFSVIIILVIVLVFIFYHSNSKSKKKRRDK